MDQALSETELAVLEVIRDQQPYPTVKRIDTAMRATVMDNRHHRAILLHRLEARGWIEIDRHPIDGVKRRYKLLRSLPGEALTGRPKRSVRAQRTCLTCSEYFDSSHAGNRRCPSCKQHAAYEGTALLEESRVVVNTVRRYG